MDELKLSRELDQALTAVQRDGESLDQIVRQYPELGSALRPLLEQAEAIAALRPEGPSRAYIEATQKRLMNRIRHRTRSAGPAPRPRSKPRFGWLRRPVMALASLALAFVVLLAMTGVVYAASESVPGEPLYGVKRGFEQARLSVTLADEARVELLHQYSNERLQEIQALQDSGRVDMLGQASADYELQLSQLIGGLEAGETDAEQLQEIQASLEHHTTVLEALIETAPAAALPGLRNAAEASSHGQAVMQALQEGRSPSELAPGQNALTPTASEEAGSPDEVGPDRTPPGQNPDRTPPGLDPDRTPGPPDGAGPPDDAAPPDDAGPPNGNPGGGPPGS